MPMRSQRMWRCQRCQNCTKQTCCCAVIHHCYAINMRISLMTGDDCCSKGASNNDIRNNATAELRTKNKKSIYEFFGHVKSLYAAALGMRFFALLPLKLAKIQHYI